MPYTSADIKTSVLFSSYGTHTQLMQVKAEWQGDFASTSAFPNLKTKYLIVPDKKYSYSYYTHSHAKTMYGEQKDHQTQVIECRIDNFARREKKGI